MDTDFSRYDALELQNKLKKRLKIIPFTKDIFYIGGCDISMSLLSPFGYGGFVTLKCKNFELVDKNFSRKELTFRYIPGLLSFREVPILEEAWEDLRIKPDILVVDGNGILHPRRLGLATHLGIILNIPTIGCAKNLLTGVYEEPGPEAGDITLIYDRTHRKEIIGAAMRTKANTKPIFISPGHLVTLEDSIRIIKQCILKHRLPEPTRLAHLEVNEFRKRW